VSEITILLLYLLACGAFAASRLPRFAARAPAFFLIACLATVAGILVHGQDLFHLVLPGNAFVLSVGNAASLIGLELALIALIASIEPSLRGTSAGLVLLAAATTLVMGSEPGVAHSGDMAWQVRAHILVALLSYGLLTVGAIVAVYALIQERRLRSGKLSPVNQLFAPLETTEKLLFTLAGAGFVGLTLAIVSGSSFVEHLVQQHLAHKFGLSVLAWLVFGILLVGRHFRGWRGKRAVRLYLGGFALLCLAYFGSRLILEQIFERSWS